MSRATPCVAILNYKNVIFFLFQIREQETGTGPAWGESSWYHWKGEEVGKGNGRVNTGKYYVHLYESGKMIPVEFQEWVVGG
jgi:hypothetical protein